MPVICAPIKYAAKTMDSFWVYLQLGMEHLTDFAGYDHMLFIVTLCAAYQLKEWRHITILVTAFTLGHTVTLGLAAAQIIVPNMYWVELLIPASIMATALFNITRRGEAMLKRRVWIHYALALVFGLIHGMGFSNYFSSLTAGTNDLLAMLLPFNLGVELGQLAIVLVFMGILALVYALGRTTQKPVAHREWNLFLSGAGFGLSLIMILERI